MPHFMTSAKPGLTNDCRMFGRLHFFQVFKYPSAEIAVIDLTVTRVNLIPIFHRRRGVDAKFWIKS